MPENTQPAGDAKPAIDPLVAMTLESLGRYIGPDGNVQQKEPSQPAPANPPPAASVTLSERVAMEDQKEKKDGQPAAPPATAPEKKEEKAAEPPPQPAPESKPAERRPAKKYKKPEPTPVPPAVSQTPAALEPPTKPPIEQPTAPVEPERDYIAGLNETQRDEYELAAYAEKVDPQKFKGRAKAVLDFFRAVDKFHTDNPDAAPESEEFRQFTEKNRPKWQPGERRKVERAWLTDQAKAELLPEMEKLRKEQHAMRVEPEIKAATNEFKTRLETFELPKEISPAVKDVAVAINKDGLAKAAQQYPVEAPILQAHIDSAQEFLRIAKGAVDYNPNNPMHKWINGFLIEQGKKFAAQPESERTVNGKVFLPLHEFAAVASKNPEDARRKHWTFNDQMILDMIGYNAALNVHAELARLEAGGLRREKKQPEPPPTAPTAPPTEAKPKTPPAPTPAASPKAGVSASAGAGVTTSRIDPDARNLLDTLMPGSSQRILGN